LNKESRKKKKLEEKEETLHVSAKRRRARSEKEKKRATEKNQSVRRLARRCRKQGATKKAKAKKGKSVAMGGRILKYARYHRSTQRAWRHSLFQGCETDIGKTAERVETVGRGGSLREAARRGKTEHGTRWREDWSREATLCRE